MRGSVFSTAFTLLVVTTVPRPADAQPSAEPIEGSTLASFVPASLGGLVRRDFNTYSVFVTALYGDAHGEFVVLQLHSVGGAGAERYLREECPRLTRIARLDACVRPGNGRVNASWVLGDRVQVILGARDEATAIRIASELDFRGLEQLARPAASPSPRRARSARRPGTRSNRSP